jgi:hypothetical protein
MSHTVESKYKNPDKFIARLKKEVDRVRTAFHSSVCSRYEECLEHERVVKRLRGESVINWAPGIYGEQSARSQKMGDFRVGDKIAIIGSVTSVVEALNDKGVVHSSIKYERLETRRLEATP